MNIKNIIANRLDIDGAVFWTLVNIFFRLVKGPLTVYFIVAFLTPQQQGIWYTFLSLAALTIFADLGFTRIISRFISHEYAYVHMEKGIVIGPADKLDRIFSLINYAIRFYLVAIPIAVVALVLIGYFFFNEKSVNIFFAWAIFSVISGLALFGSLFQSIYQGLDKVSVVNQNILIGSLSFSLLSWISLAIGAGIWALVIGTTLGLFITLIILWKMGAPFWAQLLRNKTNNEFSWHHEIISLQWRYALSFVSGYVIFQLYTPAIYKTQGAIAAGQFGLTYLIISVLNTIGSAWLTSKTPILNMMVARSQYKDLNHIFWKCALKGYVVYISGCLAILGCLWLANYYKVYNDRFLRITDASLLLLSEMVSITIGFIAEYVRAHKSEPFYVLAIVQAIFVASVVFLVLPKYGLSTLLGCTTMFQWLFVLPLGIYIFRAYNPTTTHSKIND